MQLGLEVELATLVAKVLQSADGFVGGGIEGQAQVFVHQAQREVR